MLRPRALVILSLLLAVACDSAGTSGDVLRVPSYSTVVALTSADVTNAVNLATLAIAAPNMTVAVVDRPGNLLAIWTRTGSTHGVTEQNMAVSLARTGAFMSSSQGPLTSRTLEFISTFHYPSTVGAVQSVLGTVGGVPNTIIPTVTPQRVTTGVTNTPQGPLWEIFTSNRGATLTVGTHNNGLVVPVAYNATQSYPPATLIVGGTPGIGLSYLPGGTPLYKTGSSAADVTNRVVGGLGVYVTDAAGNPDPAAAEFAALAAFGGFPFPGISTRGAIFLVGVLLPAFDQVTRPANQNPGGGSGTGTFNPLVPLAGGTDPFSVLGNDASWLIGPAGDANPDPAVGASLDINDVRTIITNAVATADRTRNAIRLPLGTTTRMIIAVTNTRGEILGLFRMEDAPVFSLDVAVAKCRTVVYLSSDLPTTDTGAANPFRPSLDEIPGVPRIAAITTRTTGFTSQPFYPPTIDASAVVGPLFELTRVNRDPNQFNRVGRGRLRGGLPMNGLNFFPGSAPLYKTDGAGNRVLVGGLGVSGDGVEQDDFVTAGAAVGFEPPANLRADNFSFGNIRLPYMKFPQLPGR